MFSLMQNIFIAPAMQHGCRAKPLLSKPATLTERLHMIVCQVYKQSFVTAQAVILLDNLDLALILLQGIIIYFLFLQVSKVEAEVRSQVSVAQPKSRWAWGLVLEEDWKSP